MFGVSGASLDKLSNKQSSRQYFEMSYRFSEATVITTSH